MVVTMFSKLSETRVPLTKDEIRAIVGVIRVPHLQPQILKHHIETLRKDLENTKIKPGTYEQFRRKIVAEFYRTLAPPGEAVGVLVGQSIGEPTTQMNLNSFHFAGVSEKQANATLVQMKRLLNSTENLTKNSKEASSLYVTLKDKTLEGYHKFRTSTVFQQLGNFVTFTEIMKNSTEFWHSLFPTFSPKDDMVFRIHFDGKLLMEYNHKLGKIGSLIQDELPYASIAWSDGKTALLDIHVEFNAEIIADYTKYNPEQEVEVHNLISAHGKAWVVSKLSLTDREATGMPRIITYETLYSEIYEPLSQIQIGGIQDIIKTYPVKNGKEYSAETDGTNLLEIFESPHVEWKKTYSDSVWEISQALGIEAAREIFIHEVLRIMNGAVDRRHVALMADRVTHTGKLRPISHHGFTIEDGVIPKASDQQVWATMHAGALMTGVDTVRCMHTAITVGSQVKGGTGHVVERSREFKQIPGFEPFIHDFKPRTLGTTTVVQEEENDDEKEDPVDDDLDDYEFDDMLDDYL